MDPTELGPTNRNKRPYNKRAPVRPDPVRAEEVRVDPVRVKKVRVRKNDGTNPMDLPREIMERFHADGIDLLWGPNTIHGQPDPTRHQQYEINAWEAVTPDMFGGVLDGLYMPRGYKGEITFGGSVLMWRPMELTLESRAEESQAARQALQTHQVKLRSGQIDNVTMDTSQAPVRANTFVRREVVAGMPVPRE